MQDADLFLSLAGIAGVFVGFGALIAVRSGGPSEVDEIAAMRIVVSMGMLSVVAALAPVALGRYDLTGHQVWALSSLVVLVGLVVMLVAMARTPEYRAGWAAEPTRLRQSSRWVTAVEGAAYMLLMSAMVLTPIIVMLGVAPELESALFFTLVVLILLGAGWTLLNLVFAQRRPATA